MATRTIDTAPVDKVTGTESALFGGAVPTDAIGYLEVFFIDDTINTLNVLSIEQSS